MNQEELGLNVVYIGSHCRLAEMCLLGRIILEDILHELSSEGECRIGQPGFLELSK